MSQNYQNNVGPEAQGRIAILVSQVCRREFSKLTESNQIFRNYFVCIHYDLCITSTQIIECIIFAPYDFQQWTPHYTILWSVNWLAKNRQQCCVCCTQENNMFSSSLNVELVCLMNWRGSNTLPWSKFETIGIYSPSATTLCLWLERNILQMNSTLPSTPCYLHQ